MAYKKYIKKDGKIYGPYLYHSKRVNDKVVSEYYGHERKRNYNKIFFSLIFVALIFLAIYGFSWLKPYFSGKATFNLDSEYEEEQPLEGVLKLSVIQGELIPSSSKIMFDNNGKILEYSLSEILSDKTQNGNFYLLGKEISGEGEGYGLLGEKKVYSKVYFDLNIFSSDFFDKNDSSEENLSNETPVSEEETPVKELPTEEQPTEEVPISEEETPVKELPTEEQPIEEQPTEEVPISEEETPVEESEPSSITGGVIYSLSEGFSNFFSLLTGRTVSPIKEKINAEVSYEFPFEYTLLEGESAEIDSGSAYILDSEGKKKKIDDSFLTLSTSGNKVVVSTEYFEIEEGFGEEYIGSDKKTFLVNLSSLNLNLEKGNFSVTLNYEEQEILNLSTILEQGEVFTNETLGIPFMNDTLSLNFSNQSFSPFMEFVSSEELNETEKETLLNHFENLSVETTKSEIFNGRLVRNYHLGDYEIEFSYDYENEITSELESQMHEDLMKWLRDILEEISKEEASLQPIESLLGNISLEENSEQNISENQTLSSEDITYEGDNFTYENVSKNISLENITENLNE